MRDITDRKVAEDELQRLATTNTLTGLPNHYQLGILLDQANRSAIRTGAQRALVFLDLDGFKLVNDTHGHSMGNELIAAVGHKLDESLRSSDLIARVGGDEVNVILYDAPEADDLAKAIELIGAISDVTLSVRGERVQISASAGVASFPMEDATDEGRPHVFRGYRPVSSQGRWPKSGGAIRPRTRRSGRNNGPATETHVHPGCAR